MLAFFPANELAGYFPSSLRDLVHTFINTVTYALWTIFRLLHDKTRKSEIRNKSESPKLEIQNDGLRPTPEYDLIIDLCRSLRPNQEKEFRTLEIEIFEIVSNFDIRIFQICYHNYEILY